MTSHDDLMTAREAQEYLGVSNRKMTQLLASGALTSQPDPLDRRVKLIPRGEVEAIKAQSAKKDAAYSHLRGVTQLSVLSAEIGPASLARILLTRKLAPSPGRRPDMPNEPDNLLRVWDVANGLQIGEETIRRWLRSGRLRGILISRKAGWRIRESDLYAFLDTITKGKSYSWPHPWPIYAKEEYEPDDEEEVDAAEEGDGEYDEGVE